MAKQPRKSFVGDHDISGIPVHLTFDENNVLVNPLGEQIPLGMIPTGTIFADEPARNAYSYGLEDVGKCYKQLDNNTLWLLINHSPLTWQALGDANQIAVLAYIDAAAREAAISGLADTDINKIALQASDNSLWQLIKSGATLTWQRIGDGAHAASVPWNGVEDKPLAFTPEIHPLNAHTVTELTPGHFLKATGTNSFDFTTHGLTSSDVGAAPNDHSHGNISYLGTLAAPSGTPIVIGASGAIEAGRFGNSTGEYCEGNDPRLIPNTNLTPGQFLKATSPNTFAFGDHGLAASSIANDSETPGASVRDVLNTLASTVNGGTTYTDTDARAACVAQTITDGVTDSAPSQDAVFDALALKADTSAIPAPYTNADAQAACIAQSITDGITTSAPSQNTVFDALALKTNITATGDITANPIDLSTGIPAVFVPNTGDVEIAHIAPNSSSELSKFKTCVNLKGSLVINNVRIQGVNKAQGTLCKYSPAWGTPVSGEPGCFQHATAFSLESLSLSSSISIENVVSAYTISVVGSLSEYPSVNITLEGNGSDILVTITDDQSNILVNGEALYSDMFTNVYSGSFYGTGYSISIETEPFYSVPAELIYSSTAIHVPGIPADAYFVVALVNGTFQHLHFGLDGSYVVGTSSLDYNNAIEPLNVLGSMPEAGIDKNFVNLLGTTGYDEAFYNNNKTVYGVFNAIQNKLNNISATQVNEGVFDLARIPAAALERLVQVPDEVARFALTTHTVQLGDTVKQLDSGAIFIVVDENNLNNTLGYVEYTAATAASVPWSGVTSKPTTLSGYGILDATPSSHIGATGIAHGVATESHNGFMSTSDKTKLENIEAGAQVNVATNIALGTVTDAAVPLTSSTGTGIVLPLATGSLAGILSATDKAKLDGIEAGAQVNVATNIALGTVSATEVPLTSSTGSGTTLVAATQSLAGIMTATDKAKLDGIEAGAQVNVATNIALGTVSATEVPLTSSTGSGTTLAAATQSLAGIMAAADKTKLDGIEAGAQVNVATNIALGTVSATEVPLTSSTGSGTTLVAATQSLAGIMTATDKAKLDGIEAGAQVNVATNIALGTVSATEVPLTSSTGSGTTLTAATQLLAGIMAATDKIKLDGIEAGAQVNVATNIALGTVSATEVPLTSSTGTGTTLTAATQLLAGIMTAADKTKLDGISVSGEPGYAATEAGTTGSASTYARGDHSHPSRISLTPPTTPVNGDIWLVG